jgi:hypothetical protein
MHKQPCSSPYLHPINYAATWKEPCACSSFSSSTCANDLPYLGQNNADSRRIEVYFMYNESEELENMAVFDNGSGMGQDDLKHYATVNYSQDARRLDLQSSGRVSGSRIS